MIRTAVALMEAKASHVFSLYIAVVVLVLLTFYLIRSSNEFQDRN